MAGKKLSFDTGVVEYDINGAYTVRFNPTDEDFVARLYDAFGSLEKLQGSLAPDGTDATFARFRELDAEMRTVIDGLLGDGAASALFPNMNCYAIADGLPVWMNLALALVDEVADAFDGQADKSGPRLEKHSAKYDAIMAKYGRKRKG